MSYMKMLRELDIMSPNISLEFETSGRYKTCFGVITSLLLIGACAVLGGLFGKEIFERKKPYVSESPYNKEDASATPDDLGIFFGLAYSNGIPISNWDDYIKVTIERLDVKTVTDNSIDSSNLWMESCDITNSGINFMCINSTTLEDRLIRGDFVSDNSRGILIKVFKCSNKERKCAADMDDVLNDLLFAVTYLEDYINPLDYDNPVTRLGRRIVINLSTILVKQYKLNILNNFLVTDTAWLLEETVETYTRTLQYPNDVDILVNDKNNDARIWMYFSCPRIVKKIFRSYMKVQELFAKIGGIVNFLNIILTTITYHYLRFQFFIFLNKAEKQESEQLFKKIMIEPDNNNIIKFVKNISDVKVNVNFSQFPLNNENRIKIENEKCDNILKENSQKQDKILNSINLKDGSKQRTPFPQLRDDFNEIEDFTFFNYISSIIFCNRVRKLSIKTVMERVEKILNIETYVKLSVIAEKFYKVENNNNFVS